MSWKAFPTMAVLRLNMSVHTCQECCEEHLPAAALCLQLTLKACITVRKLNDLLLQDLHLIPVILHPPRIIPQLFHLV